MNSFAKSILRWKMLACGTIYKLRLDYCINILISYLFFNIFLTKHPLQHSDTAAAQNECRNANCQLRNHRNNEKWWISEHKTNHFYGRGKGEMGDGGRTLLPLEAVSIINWSAALSWSGIWHLLASRVANWFGLKPKLIPALTVRSSLRFRFAWTVHLSPSTSLLHLCIFCKRLMCRLWVMHLLALRGAALMSFNFNFSFNQKCISL